MASKNHGRGWRDSLASSLILTHSGTSSIQRALVAGLQTGLSLGLALGDGALGFRLLIMGGAEGAARMRRQVTAPSSLPMRIAPCGPAMAMRQ